MENLKNLSGTKTLNKNEQQSINGGKGPCGSTGSYIVHSDPNCHCPGFWLNGHCRVCY